MEAKITTIVFYALAAATLFSAIAAVTAKSIFRAALALTACLSLIAGFFILLGADFLAAAQILVYVGGIMIIMLFVVMLAQQPPDKLKSEVNNQWLWAALFSLCVGAGLVITFKQHYASVIQSGARNPTSSAIGQLLLGEMVVPFEVVSLVLLAALVGAVLFGRSISKETAE